MHAMKRDEGREALSQLQRKLGVQAVLLGNDVPARNGNDWSASLPQTPLAVVRPVDAAGVAEAVLACRKAGLCYVPQGGLTGLCRGATPEAGWVAMSLERMVGIEEIDPASATMTVRAGTSLETMQKAADEGGLFFPLDLGSRGSCAIGGNLSTNAGGNRVIRYGMTRELVLGLEVVLPDGTIMTSLNKLIKNNAGYDLKQLFIGWEGTLGIITRVVLKLFPKPRSTMAALCAVPDYAAVLALLNEARGGLGPLLSAFEVMWPDYWEVITTRAGVRSPVGTGHGLYMLVEAQGTDEATDAPRFEAWLADLLERGMLSERRYRNRSRRPGLSGRCATSVRSSARCSVRTSPTIWASPSPSWTGSSGAARLRWHPGFPVATASITDISVTAICTWSHGCRDFRRSTAERRNGPDRLRLGPRDGRQRLGRARHRNAQEEVARACPQ